MPHDRKSLMLATLASAGQGVTFTPAQIQKLFFLIDREAQQLLEGPYFNFTPYDYGPFDRTVYDELSVLKMEGCVHVDSSQRHRLYSLTTTGFERGQIFLDALRPATKDFMAELAAWVKSLNFQQLVSAIYQHYPEMKINSVFR